MDSKGKFELTMFRGDARNICKQMLTADNVDETGKIKTLQTTDRVRRSDTVMNDIKGKRTSGTSWHRGIPCCQYGKRSVSPPPTSI